MNITLLFKNSGVGIFDGDWFIIVGLVSSIVAIICAALLLVGDSKNKPIFLMPWLVLTAFGIIGLTGYTGYIIFVMITTSTNMIALCILLGGSICAIGKNDRI